MPRTVDQGFEEFLASLTPSSSESAAAKSHRNSIESRLKSNLGMTRFFRTGSFGNGTSIRGYSDVDYFAVFPTKLLKKNSYSSLLKVSGDLNQRFNSTNIYIDSPAVIAPFGTLKKEITEIVPADFIGLNEDGYKIYDIPDGSTSWQRSSPTGINMYLKELDEQYGGKLKPLIRLIKAWNSYRGAHISSLYLALLTAQYTRSQGMIVYWIDLPNLFKYIESQISSPVIDPIGVSDPIVPCSPGQFADARSKLANASLRAQKAYDAVGRNDLLNAFVWWNKLYNDKFPNYYF